MRGEATHLFRSARKCPIRCFLSCDVFQRARPHLRFDRGEGLAQPAAKATVGGARLPYPSHGRETVREPSRANLRALAEGETSASMRATWSRRAAITAARSASVRFGRPCPRGPLGESLSMAASVLALRAAMMFARVLSCGVPVDGPGEGTASSVIVSQFLKTASRWFSGACGMLLLPWVGAGDRSDRFEPWRHY